MKELYKGGEKVNISVVDTAEITGQLEQIILRINELQSLVREIQRSNQPKAPAPVKQLLTLNEIVAMTGIPKSSWWDGIKAGRYPAPLDSFSRPKRWRYEDIQKLMERRGDK